MMRLWLMALGMLVAAAAGATERIVSINFYYQPGCHECERVDKLVLPQLAEELPGRYELRRLDTSREENVYALLKQLEQLGVSPVRNDTAIILLDDRYYLGGYKEINARLIPLVKELLVIPAAVSSPPQVSCSRPPPHRLLDRITVGSVILAGLLDGINPCVFSTLVFFLSLMASARFSRRRLLIAGASYCLACFITYLLLGFGLFRFLQLFSVYVWLRQSLEIAMVALLLLLAGISFADAWNYHRSGNAGAVQLQLPGRIKRLIHRIMKSSVSYGRLIPRAFGAGVLVTLLEAVCTGQVYVPTLVLLTRTHGMVSSWMGYLLLYNLMFLIPLLLLFAGLTWGIRMPSFLLWSRRNVVISKVLMGYFFVLMASLLLGLRYL